MMHPKHLNNLIQTDADQRFEIAVTNITDAQTVLVTENTHQWQTILSENQSY